MKQPTQRQIESAIKVLQWFGTIANMRADVWRTDAYGHAIACLEADAKKQQESQ